MGASPAEEKVALRAARLCKIDLATGMVGEFPELQGTMGREYALQSGEGEAVAEAIFEHYRPRFAGDELPRTKPGALVALADKADHLAAFFALGLRPTGSQDPYALRRQCLGLLQILLAHDFPLAFTELIKKALSLYGEDIIMPGGAQEELLGQIKEFAWQRLRHFFQERGPDHDLIEAVLHIPREEIGSLWRRLSFLQKNRRDKNLTLAAAAYTRVANLARQAVPGVELRQEFLQEEGEKELYRQYKHVKERAEAGWAGNNLTEVLAALAALKEHLDLFFDEILVMVEDEEVRSNRLALLQAIKNLYLQLADFSKIAFPAGQ